MKPPKDLPMYPALLARYKAQEQRISSCGRVASMIYNIASEHFKITTGTFYSKRYGNSD